MSVLISPADKTLTTGTKLTTTNATAVYTNTNQKGVGTKGIRCFIANTSGGAVTATVQWYDRTANVAYALYGTYSIAANTTLSIDLDGLEFAGGVATGTDGDELRVTAGSANTLEVIVITVGDSLTRGG